MFESGAVKLLSHDLSWRNLTALAVHYETQPLPTPIAWYMFQLPLWFQKVSTFFVFIVELGTAVPDVRPAPPETNRRVRYHPSRSPDSS